MVVNITTFSYNLVLQMLFFSDNNRKQILKKLTTWLATFSEDL